MKKILLSLLTIVMLVNALQAQKKIKGSDTMLPLTQKEAENYMKKNPTDKLSVTGGGSGVGIAALIDGSTELAMSSRKIKFDEKVKIKDAGKSVVEVIVAYDALAVIVNPANKVTNLTREQLEGIFTGKITNWKQVGGDDMKIVPYSRETSSGTYEFFKESVLKNKNYMPGILSMPATGAIIQSISQTKGGIGYVGLAYLNKTVKSIQVSYDNKNFVMPNVTNAMNKTYPIVRPLFYYYNKASEKSLKSYLDYVLSAEGQQIITDVGYIKLR